MGNVRSSRCLPRATSVILWATIAARPGFAEPSNGSAGSARSAPVVRPNIIFFLTDDQRWDTLSLAAPDYMPEDVMPSTRRELMNKGVVFTEAFVTSPLCCPARASLLSGGFYAHNTGVLWNNWPNGGARKFYDQQSLAKLLQAKGYRTALIGKYLVDYAALDGHDEQGNYIPTRHYVPPGWSAWMGMWSMNYTQQTGGYRPLIGASTTLGPTVGLVIPSDVRLPNDISVLSEFLGDVEARGFPHSMSEYLYGFLTQPGDFNHDGDRDLEDFTSFFSCLGGPGTAVSPACHSLDSDQDGDVDLEDFSALQYSFGSWPYITYFNREVALAFLRNDQIASQPFFLMISTKASHHPAFPAPEDADLFAGFEYRARSWGEEDLSDKPMHIREYAGNNFSDYYDKGFPYAIGGRSPDEFFADQLRCLRAVDRVVRDIVAEVEGNEQLRDNTVFVFSSDNGELWGEHKSFSKAKAYEESIRVPLIIRGPGIVPGARQEMVAMNLDVPATILHLAGYSENEIAEGPLSEGRSLVPLLYDSGDIVWRDHLLFEMWRRIKPSLMPAWAAIRTTRWKYIKYDYYDGIKVAEQVFDLLLDPYELHSLHGSPEHEEIKQHLAALLDQERGLVLAGLVHPWNTVRDGTKGVEYRHELIAEGGTGLITFALFDSGDDLAGFPEGLELTSDGVITGTPTRTGLFQFDVKVQDSSVSPQHGGPQWYVVRLYLRIR